MSNTQASTPLSPASRSSSKAHVNIANPLYSFAFRLEIMYDAIN